jgi:hypothetical protein
VLVDLIRSRQVRRVGGSETSSHLLSKARKVTAELLGKPAETGDFNAARPSVICNRLHDVLFAGNGTKEISISQAEEMLSAAGLKVLKSYEIQRLWYPHYFIIAQKA